MTNRNYTFPEIRPDDAADAPVTPRSAGTDCRDRAEQTDGRGPKPRSAGQIHIGTLIERELRRQGRAATWLAGALFCDRSNVYKLFKKKSLDTDLLLRISVVLRTDFFSCYTDYLNGAAQTAGRQTGGDLMAGGAAGRLFPLLRETEDDAEK